MCLNLHRAKQFKEVRKQGGSMLVIALFVIIVLGLLGLTMTRLLSSSSETIIYEVLGQRALNAARAGIECAIADEIDKLDVGEIDEQATACPNPISKEFTSVTGLENCRYGVVPNSKLVAGRTYWTFTSTGTCTAGKINVTRTVYVDAML
jgi:MSHA biogenesis protein MshP